MGKASRKKHEDVFSDIDRLYSLIPRVECTGRCRDTCTIIPASARERARIEKRLGRSFDPVGTTEGMRCTALTPEGRCSVYSIRPLICRLFGLIDDERMRCPYGCKPARYLREQEIAHLFSEIDRLGGKAVYPKMPGPVRALLEGLGSTGRNILLKREVHDSE